MLTRQDETTVRQAPAAHSGGSITTNTADSESSSSVRRRRGLARALRIEWLGQTVASLCWIASVLTYGISSGADWLQLCAASAWLLANVASIASVEDR